MLLLKTKETIYFRGVRMGWLDFFSWHKASSFILQSWSRRCSKKLGGWSTQTVAKLESGLSRITSTKVSSYISCRWYMNNEERTKPCWELLNVATISDLFFPRHPYKDASSNESVSTITRSIPWERSLTLSLNASASTVRIDAICESFFAEAAMNPPSALQITILVAHI